MGKWFASIDDVLIERVFQPTANLISSRIGLCRATAACFCIDMASLAWIVSRVRDLSDVVSAWDAGNAFLDLALLMLGLVAMVSLRMVFRRAGLRQANPLRLAMQPHRAIALLMLVTRTTQLQAPALADTADFAMLLSAALALYLGACTEPPPLRRNALALVPAG